MLKQPQQDEWPTHTGYCRLAVEQKNELREREREKEIRREH